MKVNKIDIDMTEEQLIAMYALRDAIHNCEEMFGQLCRYKGQVVTGAGFINGALILTEGT